MPPSRSRVERTATSLFLELQVDGTLPGAHVASGACGAARADTELGAVAMDHVAARAAGIRAGTVVSLAPCFGASARAGGKKAFFFTIGREPTPLERFRAAVVAVIEDIKRNDPRWIVRNEGHHTVYAKAKVVAYSVRSGLHTMY